MCSIYQNVKDSLEFLLQGFILKKKNLLNVDNNRCVKVAVLICVVYSSVNFIYYTCPCMGFIIIKSGFTPE